MNLQQPDLLQDRINMGDKTRDIIFQLVLQQPVAKRVARFCCPFGSSLYVSSLSILQMLGNFLWS